MVGKNASKSQYQDQKVQSFEEAFEKVHKVTGLDNIDDIVTTFIQKEDMNYSLYNYLNEINQEVERVQEVARQCLSTLVCLHKHGVIHCDLVRRTHRALRPKRSP